MGSVLAALLAVGVPAAAPADGLPTVLPVSLGVSAHERDDTLALRPDAAERLRQEALSRALLWLEAKPIEQLDLRHNPRDLFRGVEEVACRFHPRKVSGRTPKFACVFEGGEVLKVKYGHDPEIHTEVAATRLLQALGAGADTMYFIRRLRCFGCPSDPQMLLGCVSSPFEAVLRQCAPRYGEPTPAGGLRIRVDYGQYVDFGPVAVERKLPGKAIDTPRRSGWGFDELDRVGRRPQARAERDALRLVAAFLNDWDNRSDNQRLLCLDPEQPAADGGCRRALAYMQDVGATFGRVGAAKADRKLDLEGWRAVPVFRDAATCRVAIASPASHGATFGEATVSEAGRAYLARRLARLSTRQIRDLFEGAHFAEYAGASEASRDVGQWVQAFEDKVRQITARPPCPTP